MPVLRNGQLGRGRAVISTLDAKKHWEVFCFAVLERESNGLAYTPQVIHH